MVRSGPRRQRSTAPVRRAGRRTVLQVATSLWRQTGSWLAGPWSLHGIRRRRPAVARSWWRATTPLCTRCATQLKRLAARATRSWSRGVWQRFFPGSDRIRASRAGSSYSAACRAGSKTRHRLSVSMSPSSRRPARGIARVGRQRWRGRDISSASLGQSLAIFGPGDMAQGCGCDREFAAALVNRRSRSCLGRPQNVAIPTRRR